MRAVRHPWDFSESPGKIMDTRENFITEARMSTRMRLAPGLLWLIAASASAADFCTREARVDPELPAGFAGHYRLAGAAADGRAYAGTLTLGIAGTHYALERRIDGRRTRGEAWFERCGPDRIWQLAARIGARPEPELVCHTATDGDNYYRVTCVGPRDAQGRQTLEAWFQQP